MKLGHQTDLQRNIPNQLITFQSDALGNILNLFHHC
jgi:hypothetical protein